MEVTRDWVISCVDMLIEKYEIKSSKEDRELMIEGVIEWIVRDKNIKVIN